VYFHINAIKKPLFSIPVKVGSVNEHEHAIRQTVCRIFAPVFLVKPNLQPCKLRKCLVLFSGLWGTNKSLPIQHGHAILIDAPGSEPGPVLTGVKLQHLCISRDGISYPYRGQK